MKEGWATRSRGDCSKPEYERADSPVASRAARSPQSGGARVSAAKSPPPGAVLPALAKVSAAYAGTKKSVPITLSRRWSDRRRGPRRLPAAPLPIFATST